MAVHWRLAVLRLFVFCAGSPSGDGEPGHECFATDAGFHLCCCGVDAFASDAVLLAVVKDICFGHGSTSRRHCCWQFPTRATCKVLAARFGPPEVAWHASLPYPALVEAAQAAAPAREAHGCYGNREDFLGCCCHNNELTVVGEDSRRNMDQECFGGDRSYEACCVDLHWACPPAAANSLGLRIRGSRDYWDARYGSGGDSRSLTASAAASTGVYPFRTGFLLSLFEGALAPVASVLDMGVGDGLQAYALAQRCRSIERYIGVDLSKVVVEVLNRDLPSNWSEVQGFEGREHLDLAFFAYSGLSLPEEVLRRWFDVALSLQVIMHILEDELFHAYMSMLFGPLGSWRFVVLHADNKPHEQTNHLRGWRFTDWLEQHAPEWELIGQFFIGDYVPEEVHSRPDDAIWIYMWPDT